MKQPKKQARELYDKMWVRIPARYTPIDEMIAQKERETTSKDMAKKYAIIAVDLVLEALNIPVWNGDYENSPEDLGDGMYWDEVKKEINSI